MNNDNGGAMYVQEIHRCSNTQCPNKSDQGTMAVVNLPIQVTVGRTITLVMCGPCARALYEKVRTDG